MLTLPQDCKIVNGTPMVTTNGGVTCDYISCKNAHKVTIIATLLQAVAHATVLGVNEATAVAGTSAAAVTAVQRVWKNADVSTTDTLTRATDAASIAATATATNQILVMEFDPATLSSGFDCIAATLSDSSQATDFVNVTYIIHTRYPQDVPPAAITD